MFTYGKMNAFSGIMMTIILIMPCAYLTDPSPWADWWSYDGISGPMNWGLNPAWTMCRDGKFQSPIDVKPRDLLYDPSLTYLNIQTKKITGNLTNTGHDITLHIDDTYIKLLNASMGPLQYNYHIYQVKFHYGREENLGSEHTIDGQQLPAEIQVYAYNCDLYSNASQAMASPKGIAVFAIFAVFGTPDNEAFRLMSARIEDVLLKGRVIPLTGIPIDILFPDTHHYVTYEGSFTQPGCHESVTWVVFNKPIKIQKWQLEVFRHIKQGGEEDSDLILEKNHRPTMPLNNRVVRTNINFNVPTETCSMKIRRFYGVNSQFSV
ncbi:carbonic anhydrase-related protein 10-like [Argopecten irradians]|uniref:carbonic anhydrase-related protein 10-like n=1 Tax=Argopecten irradians TaxID=31199 RepID=UPI0037219272